MRAWVMCLSFCMIALSGPAEAQTAQWSVQVITDPITDAQRGIASIESREETSRAISADEVLNSAPARINASRRYLLMVKCDFESRAVYVSLAAPRGLTRSGVRVIQRFDAGEPTTARWVTTSSSIGLFSTEDVEAFTAGARRSNRIALRISGEDGEAPIDTVTFSGRGASAAISRVYQVCARPHPATARAPG